MSDITLTIKADGSRTAADAVRSVSRELTGMERSAGSAAAGTDRLRTAVSFAAGRMIYEGVAAVRSLASSALRNADATAKAAQASGISAAEYQRLAYAARLSGASMELVSVGVRTLQVAIAEGRKEVVALGMDLDALRAMSPEQQFLAVAEALRQVEDPARRTLLAVRLMGESGTRMLPMIQNLHRLRAEADQLGLVLGDSALRAAERFNDTIARLRMQAQAKIVIAVEYAQTWTGQGPATGIGGGLAAGGGAVLGGIVGGKKGAVAGGAAGLGLAELARGYGGMLGYMIGSIRDPDAAREQLQTEMATEGTWERRFAKIFARGQLAQVDERAAADRAKREERTQQRGAEKAAERAAAEAAALDADFAERMEGMRWLAGQLGDESAAQAAGRAKELGRAGTAELGRGDEGVGVKILQHQAQEEERLQKERAAAAKKAERDEKDAAETRAKVDSELMDRRARATMSDFEYRRWLLDAELAAFQGTEEQKTRLAQIAATERAAIYEEETHANLRAEMRLAQDQQRDRERADRAAAVADRAAAVAAEDAFALAMLGEQDLRGMEKTGRRRERDEARILRRAESADEREARGLYLSRRDRVAQEFARATAAAAAAAAANPNAKVEDLLERILKKLEPVIGRG